MYEDDDIGVIIVVEISGRGDSGVYKKSSLPYFYPEDDYKGWNQEGEGWGRNK